MNLRFDFQSYDSYWLRHPSEIREKISAQKAKSRNFKALRKRMLQKPDLPILEAIRQDLQNDLKQTISQIRKGQCHVFLHPTGSGKTFALIHQLANAIKEGRLTQRVVFLTRTIELALDAVKQFNGFATYLEGRNDDNCQKLSLYQAIAKKRINASEVVCRPCEHQEQCAYIHQRRVALDAQVVVATYQSFINDSPLLERFDLVVIDENLMDAGIFEEVHFTDKDLEKWLQALGQMVDDYPETHVIHRFLGGIKDLLKYGKNMSNYCFIPVNEIIDDFVPIHWTVLAAKEATNGHPPQTYKLERISSNGKKPEEIIPRMLADMLPALYHASGRAILKQDGIHFCRLKDAVEILLGKRVINLDATPNIVMLNQLFGKGHVQFHGDWMPAPNCTVTQVLGHTYIPRILFQNERQRNQLLEMALYCAKGFKKPLFVGHKFLFKKPHYWQEKIQAEYPEAEFTWFGGSTRGSNQYKSCDCVVILGNYQMPVDSLMLRVNTIRRGSNPNWGDASLDLKPVWVLGSSELVPGHIQPVHPDGLVQEALDESITAEVVQIIGRTRPLEKNAPVNVFILNGWAYHGLPIDHIVMREDLLQEIHPNKPLQRGKNLEPVNEQRKTEALQRYMEFMKENPDASERKAADVLKMSRNTIAKIKKDALNPSLTRLTRSDSNNVIPSCEPPETDKDTSSWSKKPRQLGIWNQKN